MLKKVDETMKKKVDNKKIESKVKNKELKLPTTNELEQALYKEKFKFRYKTLLKSTVYALIIVVAISVIASTLLFPVFKIYGKSMEPTLVENDIVVCMKKSKYKQGDIIAFYYNNKILVKRVIASSTEWVEIEEDGSIYVNDKLLNEKYIKKKYLGEVDIEFPYQVKEDNYFVLGDERKSSIDSRNSKIGTISKDNIIGKIIVKVWPLKHFGIVK